MADCDVAVIGAGPAGAVASALLCKKGYRVKVFEKTHFPRFSIGESLLPQCMVILEQAGMLKAVEAAGFQFKEGAAFRRGDKYKEFDFREKFTEGIGTTFQVQRDQFDLMLADEAAKMGAEINYGATITDVDVSNLSRRLTVNYEHGVTESVDASFVLDASGFGRVLPRLFDLELPSDFPVRESLFTHVEDGIINGEFDRDKILISVHPEYKDVWYWLIPFSGGRSSIGVVLPTGQFSVPQSDLETDMKSWIAAVPELAELLRYAKFDTQVRALKGYSSNVKKLWGEGYALLGNAAEFLDPVFSSGVTIAMKSAELAVKALDRQLQGETVDWHGEFSAPLNVGVDTFRTFVEGWYDGTFQDIVFSKKQEPKILSMITSILAGYAWDQKNPYVKNSQRRMKSLARICRAE